MNVLTQLNLNYLRIFVVVYQTGSMTAAAKELHLTQSGISQQIKALEESLKVTLFDRINRRIIPTSEAEILFAQCSQHIEDLELALVKMTDKKRDLEGTVKVGFPSSFGNAIVLPLIAKFCQNWPKVTFELKSGLAQDINNQLLNGTLDFGFVDSFARDPNLVTQKVTSENLHLCCRKNSSGTLENLKQNYHYFSNLSFIAYLKQEPIIRAWFQENFDEVPESIEVKTTIMDPNSIAVLIAEGQGVGLLPDHMLDEMEQHTPIHRFSNTTPLENNIYASWLAKRTMGRAAKEFYQFCSNAIIGKPLAKIRETNVSAHFS